RKPGGRHHGRRGCRRNRRVRRFAGRCRGGIGGRRVFRRIRTVTRGESDRQTDYTGPLHHETSSSSVLPPDTIGGRTTKTGVKNAEFLSAARILRNLCRRDFW